MNLGKDDQGSDPQSDIIAKLQTDNQIEKQAGMMSVWCHHDVRITFILVPKKMMVAHLVVEILKIRRLEVKI